MGFKKRIKELIHRNTVAKYNYDKKFKSIGITFEEYCNYIYKGHTDNISNFATSIIYGVKIERVGNYSFVQNVEELLVEEVYKFHSDKKTPYIIDCGANIGLSIIYFKKLFPNARIVGFEPDNQIYNVCLRNLNAFQHNDVTLYNAAVWNQKGELSFLPDNSLGGMVINNEVADVKVNKVESVRLKDFLDEEIDFLKIDIEGAELEVLEDCKNSLLKVKLLFVEYHSSLKSKQKLNEILEIITGAGFRYYIKEAWDYMENPFVDFDTDFSRNLNNDLQLNIFAYRK